MMWNFIASSAKRIGWKTWYHITYSMPIGSGSTITVSCCISVAPWLRQGKTMDDVRKFLADDVAKLGHEGTPNIIGITRIGA